MHLPCRKFHSGKPFTFPSMDQIGTGSRDAAAEWWQLPAGTPALSWSGRPQGVGTPCLQPDFTIRGLH